MLEPSDASAGHEIVHETWNRRSTAVVKGRVVVKFRVESVGEVAGAVDSLMADVDGAQVVRPLTSTGRLVLLLKEGEKATTVARELAKRPDVLYAEPDVIDRAQIIPNDPRYATQWSPPVVNAPAAWDLETGESNAVIGIIDSGISMTGNNLDHDDLSTAGRFTLGTDFVDGGVPRDLNGHGTHVAGIAAAVGNNAAGIAGMNWESPVYICRTLDANGNGSGADFADAVEEITDWAVANNKKAVINYSGGGAASQTKQDACQYASDHGMLLCAATGNDNGGPVIFPAAYSTTIVGVIAVGSTTQTDTVSPFSNVGPEVTVVAPGSDILSTTPTYAVTIPGLPLNYGTLSGTSMATPLVTGLAALMWSRHPGFANTKIKDCLQNSAVKLGAGDFNNSWGHGRVDALAALKCGDPIVVNTRLTVDCVIKTRLVTCVVQSNLTVCIRTRLVACSSRLPVLCPTTRLDSACVPTFTKLDTCNINSRICPSFVDACPSALGCRPWEDPVNPVINVIRQLIERLSALESERWLPAVDEDGAAAGSDWFYVDDEGQVHGWP